MDYKNFNAEDFAVDESFQNFHLERVGEDIQFWKQWIIANPEKKGTIKEAQKILNTISIQVSKEETSIALDDLRHALKIQNLKERKSKRKSYLRTIVSIAALFIFIFSSVFYFYQTQKPEWESVQTKFGQLNKIKLPDGSTVFLNSNSSVKYYKEWTSKTDREIWLNGEAFFDITKSPKVGSNRFVVHTDKADVNVLGTSFNVYNRNDLIEVALETGKINFTLNSSEIHQMKPNDVIRLKANNQLEKLNDVDILLYTSWKKHEIKLKKTPISKVIDIIQDNFGFEVTIKNKAILNRKLTATIPIKDVDVLLKALKEIYQLDIKKENGKIIME